MSQTAVVTHQKAIRKDNPVMKVIGVCCCIRC